MALLPFASGQDADLSAIGALTGTGLLVRTGTDTWTTRTITGTTNQVNVSNGNGVSGNPTLSLPQSIHTSATPTFGGLTLSGISNGHVVYSSSGTLTGEASFYWDTGNQLLNLQGSGGLWMDTGSLGNGGQSFGAYGIMFGGSADSTISVDTSFSSGYPGAMYFYNQSNLPLVLNASQVALPNVTSALTLGTDGSGYITYGPTDVSAFNNDAGYLVSPVDLATQVTGTLPVANGGTAVTSFTNTKMLYSTGSSILSAAQVTYTSSGTHFDVTASAIGSIPVRIRQFSGSQTGNLVNLTASDGTTILTRFRADGSLEVAGGAGTTSTASIKILNTSSYNPIIQWVTVAANTGLRFYSNTTEIARFQDNGSCMFGSIETLGGTQIFNYGIRRGSAGGTMELGFGSPTFEFRSQSDASTTAMMRVTQITASTPVLVVRGATSQSASLQEWHTIADVAQSGIRADGSFWMGGSANNFFGFARAITWVTTPATGSFNSACNITGNSDNTITIKTGATGATAGVTIEDQAAVATSFSIASNATTAFDIRPYNASNTNASYASIVIHCASSAPANGLGNAIRFQAQSSTTLAQDTGRVDSGWVDVTHASRKGYLALSAYDTAVREGVRVEADGSVAKLGFFGATAVVKPTSTTDLRTALINLGLYTSGGATPLNLNGGDLVADDISSSVIVTDSLYVSGDVVLNDFGLAVDVVIEGDTNTTLFRTDGTNDEVFLGAWTGFDEFDNGNSSTADTIDWGKGNKQKSTLTGNCTFTFTAPESKGNFVLRLIQDGTGTRLVTWPGTVKWPGGVAPTLTTTAAGIDIVSGYYDGTNYYCVASLAFA